MNKIIEWTIYIMIVIWLVILGMQGVKYVSEQENQKLLNNGRQIENFNYNLENR